MCVDQPLYERTTVYTEKQFLLCQKADGTIFLLIEKEKKISISSSAYSPHEAISSNSDLFRNDGHETNSQKHEINTEIETLEILASCRF